MKKIYKYAKGYYLFAFLSPLFIMIETIVDVLIPYYLSDMIDKGLNASPANQTVVNTDGLIMICLAIAALLAGFGSGYCATKASAGLGKNLRQALYEKIQTFSFANIDKFSTASLITRLTSDVTNVQQSFQMTIRILFRAPVMFVFALIMSYTKSVSLANILTIVGPIMIVLCVLLFFPVSKYFRLMFKKIDAMNLVTQENINGIKTVKAYTTEDDENAKFDTASKDVRDLGIKAEVFASFINPISQGCIYVAMILVAYFGAKMIVAQTLTSGDLLLLIQYSEQILFSLMMVAGVLIMLMMSRASTVRINEVLEAVPTIKEKQNPLQEVPDGSIVFSHVSFSYSGEKDKLALKDIDFKVQAGQVIGIFGATGSGKTTLISLIDRLYDVTEGEILIGGNDVRDYSLFALREACSVVLQKNVLFSGTVRSNMLWGNPDASDEEIWKALEEAQAKEFVEALPEKLEAKVEEEGVNFSGGQKQRLTIARAILKKPKILILDDSTSAVDTKTDALIEKAFKEEIPGMTKLIISQRISSLEGADDILILEDGVLSAFGPSEELKKTSKLYREIYEAQNSSRPKTVLADGTKEGK
jgi:ATP-binding cassette subfamily B multidrug efflux pump